MHDAFSFIHDFWFNYKIVNFRNGNMYFNLLSDLVNILKVLSFVS